MRDLVFVYGTLTDPERVERVLASHLGVDPADHYEFAGRATLEGLHRVEGRYPTLVPGGSVDGRVLAVDRRALDAFDAYEGIDDDLYVRVRIPRTDGGEPVWTYVGDPDRLGLEGVSWPGDETFRSRVVGTIARRNVVALMPE